MLTRHQVVIQDGQTVPGDCQLICNYNAPQDFEEFKKLRSQEKFGGGDEPPEDEKAGGEEDDQDDDNGSVHYGLSLIACGK